MNKGKHMMMLKVVLLAAIVAITVLTIVKTPVAYRQEQPLQQIGTLVLMIPLLYDIIQNRMPLFAFVGISLAIVIHVIGAQYSYSNVPNMGWCNWLELGDGGALGLCGKCEGCGKTVTVLIENATRNNFDRLVHFSFGVLLFPFLVYMSLKLVGGKRLAAVLLAWLLVQAGSIIYEIFEWQLSAWMDKTIADGYNGQQGDMWDAQKDMALAMLGSTIMAIGFAIRYKFFACAGKNVHSGECE